MNLSFEYKIEKKISIAKINKMLGDLSKNLNDEFKKESGEESADNFLNDECRIDHMSFGKMPSFSEEMVAEDEKHIRDKEEKEFGIDAENPSVAKYYFEKYGCKTSREIREKFKNEKEKSDGSVYEKVMTIILNKYLPKDFVTVRSSKYDDYENGIDRLIINKKTGEVVCTLDDFCATKYDSRYEGKKEKIKKKIERGGAKIRYGLTFENGKIERKKIYNVPAFNLVLLSKNFNELLIAMESGNKESEKEIVMGIIKDFLGEIDFLEKSSTSEKLKEKIIGFKKSLEEWQKNL